jgi:hypothetical protein
MKRSSEWDEKVIENQLKKMPKIEDTQSKELLFERIQDRIQTEAIKEKKKNYFIPTIATAAVFFLLFLIIPSFLNENNFSIEESKESQLMNDVSQDNSMNEEAGIASIEEEAESKKVTYDERSVLSYFGAVGPSDEQLYQDMLVPLGITVQAPTTEFVIPVTILVEGNNQLERFLAAKEIFSGEAFGVGNFPSFPVNSIDEENGTILKIDVPKGSFESLSSSQDIVLSQALTETFSDRFGEIRFSSDGEPGVIWGQTGPIPGFELREENRGYYVYESTTGHKFLVRGRVVNASGNEPKENVSLEETLQFMKQGDVNKGYLASVPDWVNISKVKQQGNVVIVTFAKGTILVDNTESLIMLEAIMFAAKDFGATRIQFTGIDTNQIGPYLLNDTIKIPKYMNFVR